MLNYSVAELRFLHQTTTIALFGNTLIRCISFDSYIKPQPPSVLQRFAYVVYLLIPTSNHNVLVVWLISMRLYIFWFLHQTTTPLVWLKIRMKLYIFWFLHQTTTRDDPSVHLRCCISFDSYIKPQLRYYLDEFYRVVYLLIPTSNHNVCELLVSFTQLYIFWFLHQTTTLCLLGIWLWCCISFDSYIKPQLVGMFNTKHRGCISFDSYIKPQHLLVLRAVHLVVYLLIPTSNHNCYEKTLFYEWVVYLLIPTSNHNLRKHSEYCQAVVYLLIPTSNHNG